MTAPPRDPIEAVVERGGGLTPPRTVDRPASPSAVADPTPSWQQAARDLVTEAEAALWSPEGAAALSALRGMGLREGTIRAARLGYRSRDARIPGVLEGGETLWVPAGLVIPWFDGAAIVRLKVRRLEGDLPTIPLRGGRRGGLYPGPDTVRPGRPAILVDAELDALLLGQELGDRASVVTTGAVGTLPDARALDALLVADPWIAAGAGPRSAVGRLARSDRAVGVSLPAEACRGWTDAVRGGLDVAGWWAPVLEDLETDRASSLPKDGISPIVSIGEQQPSSVPKVPLGEGAIRLVPGDPLGDVAWWSDDWRLRWGGLANAHEAAGLPSDEAERGAAVQVAAERLEAAGGPPPTSSPDPVTAFWRDWLGDLVASGTAARLLPADELEAARGLLAADPPDGEGIRATVLIIQGRYWPDRYRSLGLSAPGPSEAHWRCRNRYCLDRSRWWMSRHGVVNCRNCCRPAFPHLVVAEGDSWDLPLVEPGRSHQVLRRPPGPPA